MIPVMIITVAVWIGMIVTDEPIEAEVLEHESISDTQ